MHTDKDLELGRRNPGTPHFAWNSLYHSLFVRPHQGCHAGTYCRISIWNDFEIAVYFSKSIAPHWDWQTIKLWATHKQTLASKNCVTRKSTKPSWLLRQSSLSLSIFIPVCLTLLTLSTLPFRFHYFTVYCVVQRAQRTACLLQHPLQSVGLRWKRWRKWRTQPSSNSQSERAFMEARLITLPSFIGSVCFWSVLKGHVSFLLNFGPQSV